MNEDFLQWHNEILDAHYERERLVAEYNASKKKRLENEIWELREKVKLAQSFIPSSRIGEYLERAYGRKS